MKRVLITIKAQEPAHPGTFTRASAQPRKNLRYSHTQYRELEEALDKGPEIWPHWKAAHARFKEHNPLKSLFS